jgi:asparagine synthase (glutamine-hydrolysing)
MCGIAGIWRFDNQKVDADNLRQFTDSLIHRGPDGAGYDLLDEDRLGFGQRRLSILDTSELARQPMYYADGRYAIVYNGEVYNFLELRRDLEGMGYVFHSGSDTEVILAAWSQWGKACLDRFNGMWAFAIWDRDTRELFLARDRFGVKPLYYIHKPGQFFAFASESQAFRFVPGHKREFNLDHVTVALRDTLVLEGAGCTLYKDTWQVLPGHCMLLREDHSIARQERWYDILKHKREVPATYEEQVAAFRDLFEDSCRIRLRSDVPVASALSGGLDSSSVYCMVHHLKKKYGDGERESGNWQKAITASFPDTPMDEVEYARIVAKHVGEENWHCITNRFNILSEVMEDTTRRFDSITPTPIASISPVYRGIRENGVVVSLDGHGADEMLYGYRYTLFDLFAHHAWSGSEKRAKEIGDILTQLYAHEQRPPVARKLEKQLLEAARVRNSLTHRIKRLIRPKHPDAPARDRRTGLRMPPAQAYNFSHLPLDERVLYEDFFLYSLPTFLCDFDRASMFNHVEVRMPFMDYRLVEYCFSLPTESKLGGGYTKRILRDAMKGIVPEEILTRTFKVGIAAPFQHWLNTYLKEWALEKMKTDKFAYACETQGIQADSLIKALENNALDDVISNQIWLGLNFTLLEP